MKRSTSRLDFVAGLALAGVALCLPPGAAAGPHVMARDMTEAIAEMQMPDDQLAFFTKAAQSGKTEVAAAKIALERSKDADVRRFAERMVSDHGKANVELAALAAKKGVTLPNKLDSAHQGMLDSLRASKDFDDDYSDAMHGAHDDAVELFKDTAQNSEDADIKAFAAKTLPTLEQHQTKARELDGQH